jgi:hypothetical protein
VPAIHSGRVVAFDLHDAAETIDLGRAAFLSGDFLAAIRHHTSSLEDDPVIPTWNAGPVRATPGGAPAVLEIVEFANSNMLEPGDDDDLILMGVRK